MKGYRKDRFINTKAEEIIFTNKELVGVLNRMLDNNLFEIREIEGWIRFMYVKHVYDGTIVIGHEIPRNMSILIEEKYWGNIEKAIKENVMSFTNREISIIYEPKDVKRVDEWSYMKQEIEVEWDKYKAIMENTGDIIITDEELHRLLKQVAIKSHINELSYKTWLGPMYVKKAMDKTIVIGKAVSEMEYTFIKKKYWNLIEESIREHVKNLKGIDVEVTFDPVIEEISNDFDENLCQHT